MRANITPASCGLKCLINAVTGEVDTGTRVSVWRAISSSVHSRSPQALSPKLPEMMVQMLIHQRRPSTGVNGPKKKCGCLVHAPGPPAAKRSMNSLSRCLSTPKSRSSLTTKLLSVPTFRGLVAEVFVASPLSDGEERGNAVDKCDGLLFFRSSFFDERKIVVLRSDASDKTAKQNESDDHFRLADNPGVNNPATIELNSLG
jgi:hypothetical protein